MRSNFLSVFVSKAVSWLMIVFYLCSSFLMVAMPVQAASRNSGSERYAADNSLSGQGAYGASASLDGYSTPVMTRGYVLVSGDTLDSVAKRYNLSVEGLRRLNQDRFFKNGFDQVKAGDTVYVPIAPVSDEMARYLEGDASQNGAITSLASQA
ncbi:LysM peptidoglycan-binding domain-containing protein, partial [Bartonella sp. LJL80]